MRKLLLILMTALATAANGYAATKITAVNPASEDGGTKQVLTSVATGFDYNMFFAGTPANAVQWFSKPNVLTVWSSEWPGNPAVKSPAITKDNTVGLIMYETAICSREFTDLASMRGKTIKISTWGHIHASKFLKTLGEPYNINFVVIPYSGSGSIARGYIGGDANTTFIAESKRAAITLDGKTSCFLSSSTDQIAFRYVDAIIALNTDPQLVNQLRASLQTQSNSASWKEKLQGTRTLVGGDHLKYFNESVAALTELIQ